MNHFNPWIELELKITPHWGNNCSWRSQTILFSSGIVSSSHLSSLVLVGAFSFLSQCALMYVRPAFFARDHFVRIGGDSNELWLGNQTGWIKYGGHVAECCIIYCDVLNDFTQDRFLYYQGRSMAATGPYIIYKSSQFCAAVRSNVGFDHPLRKRIQEVTFSFPINGANTLPPRLNLKSLTTAVNVICQQVRERREKFLMKRHNVKQTRRGFHSQTKESNMSCENAIADSNIRLLGAAGFLWENERITDYELYRLVKCIPYPTTDSNIWYRYV